MMVFLNGQICYEVVDGFINEEEVEWMKVQVVFIVFVDGEQIYVGCSSMGDLLEKLEVCYGLVELEVVEIKEYDVLVVGVGFVGVIVVIYLVCKGLKVVIIVECIGG